MSFFERKFPEIIFKYEKSISDLDIDKNNRVQMYLENYIKKLIDSGIVVDDDVKILIRRNFAGKYDLSFLLNIHTASTN